MYEINAVKEKIRLFEKKYGKNFEEIELALKKEKEDFAKWDDYMEWKAYKKTFETGFYIKISVELNDASKLFISEYIDETERNYSYHWQDAENNLITMWDNAPYHKDIETFPHHLHTRKGIFESLDFTIVDILKTIEKSGN